MINVYLVNIKEFKEEEIYRAYRYLDKDRINKSIKFIREEDRKRCVCAGLLIRHCYPDYYKKGVIYNNWGKPYIKDNRICFNISHSGEWVCIATSEYEIGVDIEEVNDKELIINNSIFSKEEINHLNLITCRKEIIKEYVKIWTKKEAYFKWLGYGITKNLNAVNVISNTISELILSFFLDDKYYLSICCKDKNVCFNQLNIMQLIK